MLEHLERQTRLTGNQYRLLFVAVLGVMLEFYDLFMVGFVLAFIAGPWKITYGESAIILLTSGVGAIFGAMMWGWLADRIGRRKTLMATVINFSVATGIMVFTPTGGWQFLSVFRFFVGFGVGGLYCVIVPLVQEFISTSKRGLVSGLVTAAVPLGIGLGSVLGAFLAPVIGWRGLFAVGLCPALMTLLMRSWVPESPLWLMRMGRFDEARRSLAWALEMDPEKIQLPAVPEKPKRPPWREVFKYPRSLAVSCLGNLGAQTGIYGLTLWVPTLFVEVLNVSPERAAYLMMYCGASAICGRVLFSYLSEAIGRRLSGGLVGAGAAVTVIFAGYMHSVYWGGVSAFWLLLVLAYIFADGSFAIVGPYAAEVWPAGLRASGMGFAYGFGGIGKIIGPLGLALIAGSSHIVAPQASTSRIIPAFIYLGAWYAMAGFVYLFFGIETRGRTFEQIETDLVQAGGNK
ncbi:MAG TPA: MFS transporter [Candidatus Dormibacteraeota bacterium]|nr:MFS transporter [Candidatus Dormibacteraeota bacterium]